MHALKWKVSRQSWKSVLDIKDKEVSRPSWSPGSTSTISTRDTAVHSTPSEKSHPWQRLSVPLFSLLNKLRLPADCLFSQSFQHTAKFSIGHNACPNGTSVQRIPCALLHSNMRNFRKERQSFLLPTLSFLSVRVAPANCLRFWCSRWYQRISPLLHRFRLPLTPS